MINVCFVLISFTGFGLCVLNKTGDDDDDDDTVVFTHIANAFLPVLIRCLEARPHFPILYPRVCCSCF